MCKINSFFSYMLIRWGVKFMPGGHSSFFGLLNTFVHIIMYTYYMLAAMGPEMQKYLWWKKYLTQVNVYYEIANDDNKQKFFFFLDSNGSVCWNFHTLLSTNLPQSLQLFNGLCLLDRRPWCALLLLIPQLLQASLQQ